MKISNPFFHCLLEIIPCDLDVMAANLKYGSLRGKTAFLMVVFFIQI